MNVRLSCALLFLLIIPAHACAMEISLVKKTRGGSVCEAAARYVKELIFGVPKPKVKRQLSPQELKERIYDWEDIGVHEVLRCYVQLLATSENQEVAKEFETHIIPACLISCIARFIYNVRVADSCLYFPLLVRLLDSPWVAESDKTALRVSARLSGLAGCFIAVNARFFLTMDILELKLCISLLEQYFEHEEQLLKQHIFLRRGLAYCFAYGARRLTDSGDYEYAERILGTLNSLLHFGYQSGKKDTFLLKKFVDIACCIQVILMLERNMLQRAIDLVQTTLEKNKKYLSADKVHDLNTLLLEIFIEKYTKEGLTQRDLERAASLARTVNASYKELFLRLPLATLYTNEGRLKKAIDTYVRSLQLASAISLQLNAEIYRNLQVLSYWYAEQLLQDDKAHDALSYYGASIRYGIVNKESSLLITASIWRVAQIRYDMAKKNEREVQELIHGLLCEGPLAEDQEEVQRVEVIDEDERASHFPDMPVERQMMNTQKYFGDKWRRYESLIHLQDDNERDEKDTVPVKQLKGKHRKTFEDLWERSSQIPLAKVESMFQALGGEIDPSKKGSARGYSYRGRSIVIDAPHRGPLQQGRQQLFRDFFEQMELTPEQLCSQQPNEELE